MVVLMDFNGIKPPPDNVGHFEKNRVLIGPVVFEFILFISDMPTYIHIFLYIQISIDRY